MDIYTTLHLGSHLAAASDAVQRAGYEKAPPALKATSTRARSALAAHLATAWPEYGRKVDAGWWAGPEHVQPERSPAIVASVSLGISTENLEAHDGRTSSTSGIHSPVQAYQRLPIGGIVVDKRQNPTAVYSSPLLSIESAMGRARYPEHAGWTDDPIRGMRIGVDEWAASVDVLSRSPLVLETPAQVANRMHPAATVPTTATETDSAEWQRAYDLHRSAGSPGGMDYVGLRWYCAWWAAHGASIGIRAERDAIRWIVGPRAGELERFAPLPFYPDGV